MAQDNNTPNNNTAVSPPGYGGLSEGGVGDPSAPKEAGPLADTTAAEQGAPRAPAGQGEGGEGAGGHDQEEMPHARTNGNAIPGLLDQSQPIQLESSAEHKSSWSDEGGTGEAGAG